MYRTMWDPYFLTITVIRSLIDPFQEIQTHNRIFSENGGYGPALNWYKVWIRNLNEADEKGNSRSLDPACSVKMPRKNRS